MGMGNGVDRGLMTDESLGHLAFWLALRCPQASNKMCERVLALEFPDRKKHPPLTIQPFAVYRRHSKHLHLRERIGIKSDGEARTVLARIDGKVKSLRKLFGKLGKLPPSVAAQIEDALAAAARQAKPKTVRRASQRKKDNGDLTVLDGPVSLGSKEADVDERSTDAPFVPQSGDQREVIARQIRQRRGRQKFRNALLRRYRSRCVISGCNVQDILEAAHIKPYRGDNDNNPQNGLLLRADIHTLFDLDLLGIEPSKMRVKLHPVVAAEKNYELLAGKTLEFPRGRAPSPDALRERYRRFQMRLQQS